jgi:hypothetical protein
VVKNASCQVIKTYEIDIFDNMVVKDANGRIIITYSKELLEMKLKKGKMKKGFDLNCIEEIVLNNMVLF